MLVKATHVRNSSRIRTACAGGVACRLLKRAKCGWYQVGPVRERVCFSWAPHSNYNTCAPFGSSWTPRPRAQPKLP